MPILIIFLLPVYNLTSYLNSAPPLCYKDEITSTCRHRFRRHLWQVLAHAQ